jgi:hypothetical protein
MRAINMTLINFNNNLRILLKFVAHSLIIELMPNNPRGGAPWTKYVILNDIAISRKFLGGTCLKPKPMLRIGIESILRIDTGGRGALSSKYSKT